MPWSNWSKVKLHIRATYFLKLIRDPSRKKSPKNLFKSFAEKKNRVEKEFDTEEHHTELEGLLLGIQEQQRMEMIQD